MTQHKYEDALMAVARLDRGVFSTSDLTASTGWALREARSAAGRLASHGRVRRLFNGLYAIVPPGLTPDEFVPNPYEMAMKLARGKACLSYGTAMTVHHMTTQPQLNVYTSVTGCTPSRKILGTQFRFVKTPESKFFGTEKIWHGSLGFEVTNLEKTIADGFRFPNYCGGIVEVAKGLWIRRKDIDIEKLVDYVIKLDSGAGIRRAGYVLEAYDLAPPAVTIRLRSLLTQTYAPLDPIDNGEGKHCSRWKVRISLDQHELSAARFS